MTTQEPGAAAEARAHRPEGGQPDGGADPRDPILVVGAGVAGLGTALALSRSGHRVTLIERDATPLPADPDAAFAWDRRGAPQVRHSHALLARLHNLLRDRYPDVLDALLAAGATEMHMADNLPIEITDREPRPGDEDLVALACRRTTFEWVLRRTVLATDSVTLRHGVVVDSLVAEPVALPDRDPADGAIATVVPRVIGVRLRAAGDPAEGPTELVTAPVVVAALGRRSAVPRWLRQLGIEPDSCEEDTGLIYLSRFYRVRDGVAAPPTDGPIGGDLGYLKYAVFQGDNRTLSVTFGLDAEDRELRAALVDPDDFDRAAAALAVTRPWVDPELTTAITGVHTMGGLINRRVGFLDDQDRPLVLGFHAVGDAHTCTNPLYGRGCSLAMVQATLLSESMADHPGHDADTLVRRARSYEAVSEAEIRPWYRAAVNQDRLNRQAALVRAAERREDMASGESDTTRSHRRAEADDGAEVSPVDDDQREAARQARDFMQSLMRDGLMVAVRTDATVFRAFLRSFNLLDPPELILTDPEVVNRVLAAYQTRDERPPEPDLGPDRAGLLAALGPA